MKHYQITGLEDEIKKKERSQVLEGYSLVEKDDEKDLHPFEYIKIAQGASSDEADYKIIWLER